MKDDSKALTVMAPGGPLVSLMDRWGVNDAELTVIRQQICAMANDSELLMAMNFAAGMRFNPFARPPLLWAYKRTSNPDEKLTIDVSIDGLRMIANRSHDYEGQTAQQWCGADAIWKDVWVSEDRPVAARVGVYRHGYREPIYGIVYATQAPKTKDGQLYPIWRTHFAFMLAKNAERQALRRAFQQDIDTQIAHAETTAIEGVVIEPDADTKRWARDRRVQEAPLVPPKAASRLYR